MEAARSLGTRVVSPSESVVTLSPYTHVSLPFFELRAGALAGVLGEVFFLPAEAAFPFAFPLACAPFVVGCPSVAGKCSPSQLFG